MGLRAGGEGVAKEEAQEMEEGYGGGGLGQLIIKKNLKLIANSGDGSHCSRERYRRLSLHHRLSKAAPQVFTPHLVGSIILLKSPVISEDTVTFFKKSNTFEHSECV